MPAVAHLRQVGCPLQSAVALAGPLGDDGGGRLALVAHAIGREAPMLERGVDGVDKGSGPSQGDLAGYWSITIRANWRIVFRFEQGDVTDVDLVDYH